MWITAPQILYLYFVFVKLKVFSLYLLPELICHNMLKYFCLLYPINQFSDTHATIDTHIMTVKLERVMCYSLHQTHLPIKQNIKLALLSDLTIAVINWEKSITNINLAYIRFRYRQTQAKQQFKSINTSLPCRLECFNNNIYWKFVIFWTNGKYS